MKNLAGHNVLHCLAFSCTVLYSVLQCPAMFCTVLHFYALSRLVLHSSALCSLHSFVVSCTDFCSSVES
jgi:hypothetical protein